MKKRVLNVGLASSIRKVRCKLHGHTGELPCPWPDCSDGVPFSEFDTQLIGAEMIKESYRRRKWLTIDSSERYCWDLPQRPSWLSANKLISEEMDRLLPQRSASPSRLYHYTSLEGLFGIVSSNHLWLSDYEFLNDSSELRFSLDIASGILEEFDVGNYTARVASILSDWRQHLAATIPRCRLYVTSFSEDRDNLSLWRAYAPAGVSLGFNADLLSLSLMPGCFTNRITYSRDDQITIVRIVVHIYLLGIEWDIEKALPGLDRDCEFFKASFSHSLLQRLAFIKDPSFCDEREIRTAYIEDQELFERNRLRKATRQFRVRGRLLVPYVISNESEVGYPVGMKLPAGPVNDLPLSEVVICPTPESDLVMRSIREFLTAKGFAEVDVKPSAIPYRRL